MIHKSDVVRIEGELWTCIVADDTGAIFEGPGDPIFVPPEHYQHLEVVQDERLDCGRYVIRHVCHDGTELWWRPRSSGYTADLLAAGVYGHDEARNIGNGRPSDTAVPLVEALAGLDHGTVGDFFGVRSYLARRHAPQGEGS